MRKPTAMKRCMQEAGATSHSCSSLLVLAEGKPLTPKLRLVLGTTAVQGWIVWAPDQNALQPHPQGPAGAAQPGCQVMPTTHTSFNSPISGTGSSAPWIWQTITLRCQNEQKQQLTRKILVWLELSASVSWLQTQEENCLPWHPAFLCLSSLWHYSFLENSH